MSEQEDANAIIARNNLLGEIASQVVSARKSQNWIPCFLGLGLLVKQTLRQSAEIVFVDEKSRITRDDENEAIMKLVNDERIDMQEASKIMTVCVVSDFVNNEDLYAPLVLESNTIQLPFNEQGTDSIERRTIIDLRESDTWAEMVPQYVSVILPICRKLICE